MSNVLLAWANGQTLPKVELFQFQSYGMVYHRQIVTKDPGSCNILMKMTRPISGGDTIKALLRSYNERLNPSTQTDVKVGLEIEKAQVQGYSI